MHVVLEEPLSPELVLVSPPDVAQWARELLQAPPAPVVREGAPSRAGAIVFGLAALVNCAIPVALLVVR